MSLRGRWTCRYVIMNAPLESLVEEDAYKTEGMGRGIGDIITNTHQQLSSLLQSNPIRITPRTNLEYSIQLHQYLTIITTTFFKMLSNLLRDITMSSTSNSHLNYAPSSSSTKSAKTTSTTVSECSDTVSLSSQKTLVGKVFSRKCESHILTLCTV